MPNSAFPRRALAVAALLRAAAALMFKEDARPTPFPTESPAPTPAQTPAPTPAPTAAPETPPPTRHPTPFPTPFPTYVTWTCSDGECTISTTPGVPCQCHEGTCWATYNRNNDSCLTQEECDLQAPLMGNCSSTLENPASFGPPVWDQDGDGCINYTEWDIIYTTSNGSCCPQEPPEVCEECPPGHILQPNPCECVPCLGDTRRRRALECTPCPPPLVKDSRCEGLDECCDPLTTAPCQGTEEAEEGGACQNNSNKIPVYVPFETCDPYNVGDTITLTGTVPGDTSTFVTHTGEIVGRTSITGGYIFEIDPPLTQDFSPVGGNVQQTCSSTDGTEVSASYSYASGGGCCCSCGTNPGECCESTEVCTVYPNGTGTCTTAGPYPEFSTPAPTVGAKGDPHLVNLQGEHFDINHDGKFMLLRFPQAAEKPPEFTFVANVQPDFGKPCTTYITEAELSGAWLGGWILQIRSYRKSHSNDTDAFFGARLFGDDEIDPPWHTIEEFETNGRLELSEFGIVQTFLEKATWFPKKRSKAGPTVAGMFTLSLKNMHSGTAAKITIRQDLPEQEHLNVAVRQLSQLGRVDVGGLLGFDPHPESLERQSAACVHHRATARYRIESQDDADHGYYFRPTWKDRWDSARSRPKDTDASASMIGGRLDGGASMCKCSSDASNTGSLDGVLVDEASFVFADASWE